MFYWAQTSPSADNWWGGLNMFYWAQTSPSADNWWGGLNIFYWARPRPLLRSRGRDLGPVKLQNCSGSKSQRRRKPTRYSLKL